VQWTSSNIKAVTSDGVPVSFRTQRVGMNIVWEAASDFTHGKRIRRFGQDPASALELLLNDWEKSNA
jgi:hypothetical protein